MTYITNKSGQRDEVSLSFADKVMLAVSKIPRGRVASYAAVAAAAGSPRAVRAVGNILHKNRDPVTCPCHRVVNIEGRLAPRFGMGGPAVQKERLEAEGVPVSCCDDGYYVDLKKYGYSFVSEKTKKGEF